MISTVTTSTVTTVTTAAIAGSVALISILLLLSLLVQKELATGRGNRRLKRLQVALNIGIVPLFIGFVLIVASRINTIIH
jgi:hypothetical protein